MPGAYLSAIVFSLLGLAGIDYRVGLALFKQTKRTLLTLGIGLAFFLIWDLNGIALGIFWEGSRAFLVGVDLLPQMPLEEPFFLILLCYMLLLCYLIFSRASQKSADRGGRE